MDTHDFSLLPNDNIKNGLIDLIENKFHLKKYSIHIESGSAKGDNYIGVVYRAQVTPIEYKNESRKIESQSKPISIIIKVPPGNAARREQFLARPCFLRESLVYDEILPMWTKFQERKGIVPQEHGFHEYSECYKCLTDDMYEGIFLRDLREDGFAMNSRFNSLTKDHVLLAMQALGKFHALSFAAKDQCPELLEPYKDIKDVFASRDEEPQLMDYFTTLIDRTKEALSEEKDKKLLEAVENYLSGSDFLQIFRHLVLRKNAEPYAVLCHGDCWNNNMLYKHNQDGKPLEIRLIDWQICRYGSPVLDIVYYIFSGTSKEVRDKHYSLFLDTYYNSLTDLLQKLGSDPEKMFPRKAFEDQMITFGSFGFLMAMMLLPIISSEVDDIPDLDLIAEQITDGTLDTKTAFNAHKTEKIYKQKMRDVVQDTFELGYLKPIKNICTNP